MSVHLIILLSLFRATGVTHSWQICIRRHALHIGIIQFIATASDYPIQFAVGTSSLAFS